MEKEIWKRCICISCLIGCLLILGFGMVSCKDDYKYVEEEPGWLGGSIYDYLKEDGRFNYYVKLINDVGYAEVMARTGSKTLFVTDDAAFERFFQNNTWGVSSYTSLTLQQKRMILFYGMIDNAYVIENLANFYNGSDLVYGSSVRRRTSLMPADILSFESGEQLPDGEFWKPYEQKGIYLVKDNSRIPVVYFLSKPLKYAGITDNDFKKIVGVGRSAEDTHILNRKVIQQDITCKNGYIHVLDGLLIPPTNIAEHLRENPRTTIFSKLLERFSGPYYDNEFNVEYKRNHPEFTDSIFVKSYFSNYGGVTNDNKNALYPDGTIIENDVLLPYNPGWNSYKRNLTESYLQSDMAAILAPSDDAMEAYFNEGEGVILQQQYGTWDNVPDDKVVPLIRRHLRESFLNSIPGRFNKMNDSENSPIPADSSHIEESYIGVNGVVYVTSKVYPPDDYVSVYGPVLFSDKTKIIRWAILNDKILFRLYLNAMESRYSFFVPTDEFFKDYIDPIAFGMPQPAVLKYWLNTAVSPSKVYATVYTYDPVNNTIGDSVNVITNETFIVNRLSYILDSHIVVGDVETNGNYYLTKGVNVLKVEGTGMDLKVQGGGDVMLNKKVNVTQVFEQDNGRTYFIDKPIQTPLQSVYKVLSTTPQFSEFFSLMDGFTTTTSPLFMKATYYFGIDRNVKFLNTFNYTVYVPSNAKIQEAIAAGRIPVWESRDGIVGINQMDAVDKAAAISKLERFIRYHFQDNSTFISGSPVNKVYQTATIKTNDVPTHFGTFRNKYYKLGVSGEGDSLKIVTEVNGTARVVKENGLFNIMTCDYIFNNNPIAFQGIEVPNTTYGTSTISTSATAVIHEIDNILMFE